MDLLELVGDHVFPTVHILMIEPFKSMWENDRSDNHENCLKDFSYIEFMCSPKKSNPYFGYTDIEMREKVVKKEVYKDENYSISSDILLGTMKYNELLANSSPSFPLLNDAIAGAEKNRVWCKDFDLDERTPNGAAVLKPADINRALKEIPSIVRLLEDTRDKVNKELAEASKTRRDREINHFER